MARGERKESEEMVCADFAATAALEVVPLCIHAAGSTIKSSQPVIRLLVFHFLVQSFSFICSFTFHAFIIILTHYFLFL